MKKGFAFSVLALSVASASQVMAQDNNDYRLEEVTVTAEKVESTAQETPRAISVFSAEELEATGTKNLDTLLRNVPGINIQGGFNQLYVRGIGSNSDPGQGESSVAINVDGANQFAGSGTGVLNALFDVERVEVLRGPSGAVNGRNAIGGVVNVVSRKPELDEFSGNGSVGMGNYNSQQYSLGVNVPLTDTLAIRVAGQKQKHDGYIHAEYCADPAGPPGQDPVCATAPTAASEDVETYRIRALWAPTDEFELLATYNELEDSSNRANGVPNISLHPDDPWLGQPGGAGPAAGANITKTYNLEMAYDFDFATLTFQPNKTIIELSCDTNVTAICPADQEQTTYEVRLNSPAESTLEWMVGAYQLESAPFSPAVTGLGQFNTNVNQGDLIRAGTTNSTAELQVNQTPVPTESEALYGNILYPVTDSLRLQGSFRYTHDSKKNEYVVYAVSGPDGDPFNATFTNNQCDNCEVVAFSDPILEDTDDKPFTWTIGVEYDITDSSMLYASMNTGFKAGGVSPVIVPPRKYEREKLTAYALGAKNRFLDDKLQVNAEAYYYKYDGFQINLANESQITRDVGGVSITDPNEFQSITYNADEGTMYGLELEVDWLITRDDRFKMNAAYSSAEYGALDAPLGGPPWFPADFELTGGTMAQNPDLTASFSYEHTFHVMGGSLAPRIDVRYSSEYYTTAESFLADWPPCFPPGTPASECPGTPSIPDILQESFWKYDAYINYTPDEGNYSVNVYAKNIKNTAEITFQTPGGTSVTNPYTYGMSVNFWF